jgi:hypothetical protein
MIDFLSRESSRGRGLARRRVSVSEGENTDCLLLALFSLSDPAGDGGRGSDMMRSRSPLVRSAICTSAIQFTSAIRLTTLDRCRWWKETWRRSSEDGRRTTSPVLRSSSFTPAVSTDGGARATRVVDLRPSPEPAMRWLTQTAQIKVSGLLPSVLARLHSRLFPRPFSLVLLAMR